MKYKIILDKQSRTNPSSERKEYEIDIEELRTRRNVYDSIVITREEAYVLRKLALSDLQVLSELSEPVKEPLNNLKIELFEGDNYIYLVDMVGNKFYAEYLIKNEFTDLYVTLNEMNSAINQSAQQIDLTVNQKLEGYSTTQEMNSAINMKANEITSTVQSNYATKEALNTAKSEIKQTTDSITSTVSKKVGNDEIISKINQSAEQVSIKASKIDINGTISANGNFKVDTNGNMACNNATFNGGKIDLISNASNPAFNVKGNDGSSGYFSSRDISISELSNSGIPAQASLSIYESGNPTLDLVGRNLTSSTMVSSVGIETPKLTQTSLAELKKNFEILENGLDIVKATDIYKYNLKSQKDNDKKHIGFVIGDNYNYSKEITSENNDGVDLYSMLAVAYKAIQELSRKIEKLEVQNGKN